MATVLIIGRPNVGKSTLFNRLVGGRRAIVDDQPGVTRDFAYGSARWQNKKFKLVDTCGLFESPKDALEAKMKDFTLSILEEGDVILFVVDGRNGLASTDFELADMLRKMNLDIVLVANKVENDYKYVTESQNELYQLGLGDPLPVSAAHGTNTEELLEVVIDKLEAKGHIIDDVYEDEEDRPLRVAIVGKPNAGKSSLFNSIIGSERSLVTEIPGTTRDTVDETLVIDGKPVKFIDTAGMRKKSKVKVMNVEYYSVMRAVDSIESADIVLMVMDSKEGIGNQDQRIAGLAEKNGKGIITVFSKSDTINQKQRDSLQRRFKDDLYFVDYSPVVFTSSKTGKGLDKLLDTINLVAENIDKRVSTGLLNNLIARYIMSTPPVGKGTRRAKIYYSSQIANRPPLISLIVNDPGLFNAAYLRGIRRTIRMNLDPFEGTPIFIKLRRKK